MLWITGQMSETGKTPSDDAHLRPTDPSILMNSADTFGTGNRATQASGNGGITGSGTRPAVDTMGMSVALDSDARLAAAAKVPEEHGLVRTAQAGGPVALSDVVGRV